MCSLYGRIEFIELFDTEHAQIQAEMQQRAELLADQAAAVFDELAEQVESEQERNDERRQLAESLRDLPADEARAVLKAVRGGAR